MSTPVTEIKRKLDGRTLRYRCEGLEQTPARAVLRYRLAEPVRIAGGALELPAGTRTFAVYWPDRPYNVYHWVGPAGDTLAVYCNVATDTVFRPAEVEWLDLEVDVLIEPGGRVQVLDEEQLPSGLARPLRRLVGQAVGLLTGRAAAVVREAVAITAVHLRAGGGEPHGGAVAGPGGNGTPEGEGERAGRGRA